MSELDERREQLIRYVASQAHPWDSVETVRLFEAAVRREAYEEGYTACLVDREPDEHDARVRHEHGERIAKAIEPRSNGGISRGSVIRLGALDDAARLARELSPPP